MIDQKAAAEFIALVGVLFEYNAEEGVIRWKSCEECPTHLRGRIAGEKGSDGYRYIKLNGRRTGAHRIAWILHYKEIPDQIDHINMVRSDNRVANLRNASIAENNRNRRKQSNNTSGYKGVTFHKASKKYNAKIMADKKRYSLGHFNTAEEASIAYQTAARSLHGQFART
jgi:hypothetical protein